MEWSTVQKELLTFVRRIKGKGYENFVERLYQDVLTFKHTDAVLQDDIMLIGVELGTIQKNR